MRKFTLLILLFCGIFYANNGTGQTIPVFQSEDYALYGDSVTQGNFTARAISRTSLISNYQSPANLFQSADIIFKFSINGKDNEMRPGLNHQFSCASAVNRTPVIKFGEQFIGAVTPASTFLKPDTKWVVRLDMRAVLSDFKTKGYFTTYNGDKIFKEDFKGVYIAGPTAPMNWDFDNLVHYPMLQLKDPDGDGIYETTLILNANSNKKETEAAWTISRNTKLFPQYHSEYPITDVLYNLSLGEMMNAVEPDSTFRTGKLWAGVWTRDISYSIILSMAYLQPEVAKKSLLKKVSKDGRIIQDTGTGGAYPCSTDRMIWAVAAYEVYLAIDDKNWLKKAYEIIRNSIDDDTRNAYDKQTGMVRGESSFLDWREQTYPRWMQPADIYNSENLGTNAVHYQANIVAAKMGGLLHDDRNVARFQSNAAKIKKGINDYLWLKDKGYYAQYLYGRNFSMASPRSEALGEALCVLFDIASPEQQKEIIARIPVGSFGISCIFPQIPGIPPYHNNAVWPFVESYWALASAKAGNEASVMEALASISRAAALFVTNKENLVADDGDFAGTQINSGNMLWSLSGSLAMVHKLLFGIHFQPSGLSFQPFVPAAFQGKRTLDNFRYHKSILDISMEGFGNRIATFIVDGKPQVEANLPSGLLGKHKISILLNNHLEPGTINKVSNEFSPSVPVVKFAGNALSWAPLPGIKRYEVFKNGALFLTTNKNKIIIPHHLYSELQVVAVDNFGLRSFASEPIVLDSNSILIELEDVVENSTLPYKGFSGKGFIEISTIKNISVQIPVTITEPGEYSIDFRYANGNGPTNTENKCAIRTLEEGNDLLGTIVFPQRGSGEWSNWGNSNAVKVNFETGKHILTLQMEHWNENMNKEINQAMLDNIRLILLKRKTVTFPEED